jgi:hypothetical protein
VVLSLCDGWTAEPLARLTLKEAIDCLSFDPSGKSLAMGDRRGILQIMDIEGVEVHRGPP